MINSCSIDRENEGMVFDIQYHPNDRKIRIMYDKQASSYKEKPGVR
jgi:hypothetical protein